MIINRFFFLEKKDNKVTDYLAKYDDLVLTRKPCSRKWRVHG